MAQQEVNIGVEGNDGTGDSIREAFRKTNENFQELYAVFNLGGTISFIDLDNTPSTWQGSNNKILAVNAAGTDVDFKSLIGIGIGITHDDINKTITLRNTGGNLQGDTRPSLSFHLNAANQIIGNLMDPDDEEFTYELGRLNDQWEGVGITRGSVAATVGYSDRHYIDKAGSTMTGPLYLFDHPGELAGRITENADDLQAATKYYVDNSSYTSTINLYVSTTGDDLQTNTPYGKEGRAWSYAYKTIAQACAKAEELLQEAPLEPGPYRQLIAFNNGASFSEVTEAIVDPLTATAVVKFSNYGGAPVDQGRSANVDITPGKIIYGRDSKAQGIITKYVTDGTLSDYVELKNVIGEFEPGENLEFGAPVKDLNISVFVESGVYFEDLPIRVPRNTAILGDEFRRTILRPRDRVSQSRWVDLWFYRDRAFDGMTGDTDNGLSFNGTAAELNTDGSVKGYYGYHYLSDPTNRNSQAKNNKDIDVFLCNDSTIIRQIAIQGHGGFTMVLDPDGQILTKSPYGQNNSSFSGSLNKQAFRGGQYVDAFVGNLPATVVSRSNGNVNITNIRKEPQTPTSFFISGNRYEINTYQPPGDGAENSARLLEKNKDFIRTQAIAYIATTSPLLNYKKEVCSRDVGYIVDALAFDLRYKGNIKSVDAARKYYAGFVSRLPIDQKGPTLALLNYLKNDVLQQIVQNITVDTQSYGQFTSTQVKDLSNPGEVGSYGNGGRIPVLVQYMIDIINGGLASTPAISYPEFKLIVSASTPLPATLPAAITLQTAGNCSMLSNDFTQLNDLGYGLVANNNGLIETVSVFTYYCWTAMYAAGGGQIRSLNGSNSHGEYGIVAEGSDPLEVPDPVKLEKNQIQLAKIYRPAPPSDYNAAGKQDGFDFFIVDWAQNYPPFDQSFCEINHGNTVGIKQYAVSSISDASIINPITNVVELAVLRVQLTSSSVQGVANALAADLVDGMPVAFRAGNQQQFYDVKVTRPAKPSTALTYTGDPNASNPQSYRVISYITDNPLGVPLQRDVVVTAISNTNPVQITSANHGIATGSRVRFSNVLGTTQLNGNDYYIRSMSSNTFQLYNNSGLTETVDGTSFGTFIYTASNPAVATVNGDRAILETDEPFEYIELVVNRTFTREINGGKTQGGTAGDTKIAVESILSTTPTAAEQVTVARLNSGQMLFAWSGKMHRIVSYTTVNDPLGKYGLIEISDTGVDGAALQNVNPTTGPVGLYTPVDPNTNNTLLANTSPQLFVGLSKDEPAEITVRTSTCRATGHDFLDIGTGSYNNSNFPNRIYGVPANPVDQSRQVSERGKGRVYYVSTDQDGFFRVGRFFTVNQGTGDVGINAGRLVLEGVAGLKFRKGVRVTEFTANDDFSVGGDLSVPTTAAIRGYITRILGIDQEGNVTTRPLGDGFLDRGGVLAAVANINLGDNKLINVKDPTSLQDAATKNYADSMQLGTNNVDTQNTLAAATNHLLVFNGTQWVNGETTTSGDIQASLGSNKALSLNIKAGAILNNDVNNNAGIAQSKLAMNKAGTRANATDIAQADLGLSSFNAAQFNVVNGWVEYLTSISTTTGVTLEKIRQIPEDCYIGRRAGTAGDNVSPTLVSSGDIVLDGDGIKHADILTTVANGAVIRTGTKTYDVVAITTTGAENSLVKTEAGTGGIDVKALKIDAKTIIDTASDDADLIKFFTPGAHAFMTAKGTDGTTSVRLDGNLNVNVLSVDSKKILDVNSTTLEIYAPAATEVKTIEVASSSVKVFGSIETSGAGTNITAVATVKGVTGEFTTETKTPKLTATGSNSTGTISGKWSLEAGATMEATFADLAEYYQGDKEYATGTVLVFGGAKEVTATNVFGDRRVAGVVSTNAAYIMNAECPGTKVLIALQGRVPVKVVGRVKKGDMLVTSATSGYAVANADPKVGTVIGKALQDKDDGGEGVIEVAVGRL